MKRIFTLIGALVLGLYVISIGTAFAQDGAFEGLPPSTALFNDALLFARVLPFVAALGIGFGIWQAKTSLRRTTPADATTVIRHDVGTVVAHWTNGVGFIVGIITGAMVLRWIQRPDDIRLVFFIHYVGASLVMFGIASHLAQHFVTGGMGLLPRSFREVREGLGEVIEYTGIFGPTGAAFRLNLPKGIRQPIVEILTAFGIRPPKRLGKYLPAERVFSYLPWVVIIAGIVFTGLVKAGRYLYPVPASFVAQMTTLHDLFTALAVVMLIVHLAAVTLAPRNWPLLKSMFTTRVPLEHIKTHHPLWYEALRATRTSKEPVKPIGVEHPAEPTAAPTGE